MHFMDSLCQDAFCCCVLGNLDSCDCHVIASQGFFQALSHNTVFVFQLDSVNSRRPFLVPKASKNQEGIWGNLSIYGLQNMLL